MKSLRAVPLLLGLAVAGAFAIMAAVGSFLPEEIRVTRGIELGCSAEEAWSVLTDLSGYPEWVPGLESSTPIPDPAGRRLWEQTGAGGTLTLEAVELERGRAFETRVIGDDPLYENVWIYEIEPRRDGCLVALTQRGRLRGRVGRFLAHFVFGRSHAQDAFLGALAAALDQDARPGPAPAGSHAGGLGGGAT